MNRTKMVMLALLFLSTAPGASAGVHLRNDVVYGLGGNEILLDDPSGNAVELFQPTYTGYLK